MLAMGVLLWWSSLGLKLACEKGSFGSEVVWIGTHLMVNSRANKVEVRLLAKKNVEILTALSDLMDGRAPSLNMMRSGRSLARRVGWQVSCHS